MTRRRARRDAPAIALGVVGVFGAVAGARAALVEVRARERVGIKQTLSDDLKERELSSRDARSNVGVTYADVDADDVLARALGVTSSASRTDEAGAELTLAARARGSLGGDGFGRAMRRIRGSDVVDGGVDESAMRVWMFAPNGRGGRGAAKAIAASGRRAFVGPECERELALSGMKEGENVVFDAEPLAAYLRERAETNEGTLRGVVMTCGDEDRTPQNAAEAFAKDLETIERAGVPAVGILFDEESIRAGATSRPSTGRSLLASDASSDQECGFLCETQVQVITGVVIFWGLLLTLVYGWGLMTDLDTPTVFAKPDDSRAKQD